MLPANTQPTLSPSLFHRHLMDTMQPAMSYDGGDVAEWQARLRPKVRELVGLPGGDRIALNPRVPLEARPSNTGQSKNSYPQQRTRIRYPRLSLPASKRAAAVSVFHLCPRAHHWDASFDSG